VLDDAACYSLELWWSLPCSLLLTMVWDLPARMHLCVLLGLARCLAPVCAGCVQRRGTAVQAGQLPCPSSS
jgi:hypothetical protein